MVLVGQVNASTGWWMQHARTLFPWHNNGYHLRFHIGGCTPIYDPIMQGQGLGIQAVYMSKHTSGLVSITKRILYMREKLLAK